MMQAATNPALLSVPLKKFADYGGFDADVVGEDDILIILGLGQGELQAPVTPPVGAQQ